MTDARSRQPVIDMPRHPCPGQTMTLAAPPERAHPQPADLATKEPQRWTVHRHAVIADVTADDAAQPRALLADGTVHALRPIRSAFQPVRETLEVRLQRPPPSLHCLLRRSPGVRAATAFPTRPARPSLTGDSGIYPARPFPCRRFDAVLADDAARLGTGVGR